MMNVLILPILAAITLCGRTDRAIPLYAPGEEMRFEVRAAGAVSNELDGCVLAWKRTGDDGKSESGKVSLNEKFVYRTSLDRAGFVRLEGTILKPDGKPFQIERANGRRTCVICDLGAGVDIAKIRTAVPAPADLGAFWQRRKAALAKVEWAGRERLKEVPSANPKMTLYEFVLPCWGGKPATGYLALPRTPGKYAAQARFSGYGVSWNCKRSFRPPTKISDGLVQMWVNPHGVEMGRDEAYYQAARKAAQSNGYSHGFDPAQNADAEKTYWAGVSARILRALEYLKSRPEWNGRELTVTGGSQGGMQAVWCAALDEAVTVCDIFIPWNCDIGGETIGRNRGNWYVKWVPALGYYDTANLGAMIPKTCRVNVSQAGLGDYICPPTGVMAFYNGLKCPKRITWIQNHQHGIPLEEKAPRFTLVGDEVKPR